MLVVLEIEINKKTIRLDTEFALQFYLKFEHNRTYISLSDRVLHCFSLSTLRLIHLCSLLHWNYFESYFRFLSFVLINKLLGRSWQTE